MTLLGRTQRTIYDYVRVHPDETAEFIGAALYATTSSCASMRHTEWPREKIQRQWALKVLGVLKKKGLVVCADQRWRVK